MSGLDSIRAVTFDVGGTLIEPWPSVGHVYARVAARFGMKGVSPEALTSAFMEAWKARGTFDYSPEAWRSLVQDSFTGVALEAPSQECFEAIYEEFARAESWRVYDDVEPTLARLKTLGLRLGVISNWDERLRPLLAGLKLDRWFEVIVASHDLGRSKPDRALFSRAATQLGSPLDAILHVGDSVQEDVTGAQQAGMKSLLLRRGAGGAREKETIASLDEVR